MPPVTVLLDLVVSRGLANKDIRLAKLGIKIIVRQPARREKGM